MNSDCWHSDHYKNSVTQKSHDLLSTEHGKVLQKILMGIRYEKTIDLGCGGQSAKQILPNYTGVDLPEFDVYETDCKFIKDYDLVLMNAFIDVMEKPVEVMDKVLSHCKKWVVIHRQELTPEITSVEKRESYGSWTWHSKINEGEFYDVLRRNEFIIKKRRSCGFDNWNEGGLSFLLEKL